MILENTNPAIICVFIGDSPCMKSHLESILDYSPKTPLHVLCDANMGEFGTLAKRFQYEHHSFNEERFEKACFLRWFYICEYAAKKGIKAFWVFDHDVLVFTELASEPVPVRDMSSPIQPYFCNDLTALKAWCDFLIDAYADKSKLNEFVKLFTAGNETGGLLNDLAFGLYWAKKRNLVDLANNYAIQDGAAFDHNLAATDNGFVVDGLGGAVAERSKRLEWRKGQPYALHSSGAWVRLKTLHCWGSHKARMAEYLLKARQSK